MFRVMRVRPPNGWGAVLWELAIVTAGVLIALFVQEWAEKRSWRARAAAASVAVREDLEGHLLNALEYRLVEPCVDAQLRELHRLLADSGDTLAPAPLSPDPFPAVVRFPKKSYVLETWEAALADGAAAHVPAKERNMFRSSRRQGQELMAMQDQLANLVGQLNVFSTGLRLSPEVRAQLGVRIEEARNVNHITDLVSGQVARRLTRGGIRPTREELRRAIDESKTVRHCRSKRLPLRPSDQLIPPESR